MLLCIFGKREFRLKFPRMPPSALRMCWKIVINRDCLVLVNLCDCSSREKSFQFYRINFSFLLRRATALDTAKFAHKYFSWFSQRDALFLFLLRNVATIAGHNFARERNGFTICDFPVICWHRSRVIVFLFSMRETRKEDPRGFLFRENGFVPKIVLFLAQLVTPGHLQWRSSPIPTIPPALKWSSRSWRTRWSMPSIKICSPWSRSPSRAAIIIAVIIKGIKRTISNVSANWFLSN